MKYQLTSAFTNEQNTLLSNNLVTSKPADTDNNLADQSGTNIMYQYQQCVGSNKLNTKLCTNKN